MGWFRGGFKKEGPRLLGKNSMLINIPKMQYHILIKILTGMTLMKEDYFLIGLYMIM